MCFNHGRNQANAVEGERLFGDGDERDWWKMYLRQIEHCKLRCKLWGKYLVKRNL